MQDIIEWRDEEAFKLMPLKKEIARIFYPFFSFDKRIERLNQIVDFIEAAKAKCKYNLIFYI